MGGLGSGVSKKRGQVTFVGHRCGPQSPCRSRSGLTRAWAFLREKASTEPEVSALDQEYERQIVEGPRYHRGNEFIDVPRINCDRNFLAKVLFIARAIEKVLQGPHQGQARGCARPLSLVRAVGARLALREKPAHNTAGL